MTVQFSTSHETRVSPEISQPDSLSSRAAQYLQKSLEVSSLQLFAPIACSASETVVPFVAVTGTDGQGKAGLGVLFMKNSSLQHNGVKFLSVDSVTEISVLAAAASLVECLPGLEFDKLSVCVGAAVHQRNPSAEGVPEEVRAFLKRPEVQRRLSRATDISDQAINRVPEATEAASRPALIQELLDAPGLLKAVSIAEALKVARVFFRTTAGVREFADGWDRFRDEEIPPMKLALQETAEQLKRICAIQELEVLAQPMYRGLSAAVSFLLKSDIEPLEELFEEIEGLRVGRARDALRADSLIADLVDRLSRVSLHTLHMAPSRPERCDGGEQVVQTLRMVDSRSRGIAKELSQRLRRSMPRFYA